ncbi:hypothetical protein HN011_009803 [Eciton burchellii]|nr:hypothetical protein HN011_009803 [Eciton burchellii]
MSNLCETGKKATTLATTVSRRAEGIREEFRDSIAGVDMDNNELALARRSLEILRFSGVSIRSKRAHSWCQQSGSISRIESKTRLATRDSRFASHRVLV